MEAKGLEKYSELFEGIELIVRSKINEDIEEIIFNNDYLSNNELNASQIKKELEKLLRRARKNYAEAKKLYHRGKLSEDDLYEYKRRIDEILKEINNLNL